MNGRSVGQLPRGQAMLLQMAPRDEQRARSVSCADEEGNRCSSLSVRLDGGNKTASPSFLPRAEVSLSQPRLSHRLSLSGHTSFTASSMAATTRAGQRRAAVHRTCKRCEACSVRSGLAWKGGPRHALGTSCPLAPAGAPTHLSSHRFLLLASTLHTHCVLEGG